MSNADKPQTTTNAGRLRGNAAAILERNAALGQNIRAEARALVSRCDGPVDRDGFILVRKADVEALAAALDAEETVIDEMSGTLP